MGGLNLFAVSLHGLSRTVYVACATPGDALMIGRALIGWMFGALCDDATAASWQAADWPHYADEVELPA